MYALHKVILLDVCLDLYHLYDSEFISQNDPSKLKRKFSSFFKSLVIELDKDLYGPDNHLVEWHRTATTQETDGFQVCVK